MSQTVFEKVISGEYEGSFVYKDEVCVAFMDLHPLNDGHVLVVPRKPVEKLTSLDAETATHIFAVAQRILKAIENSGIKTEGANLFLSDGEAAGQDVPHIHLHIVPRYSGDRIQISFGKEVTKASRNNLNQVAEKICAALNS
ncbi:MAG: HIT family protein [Bdellovibrio sp.]